MLTIHVYTVSTNTFKTIEFNCLEFRDILNAIGHYISQEQMQHILETPHYFMAKTAEETELSCFIPHVHDISVTHLDTMYIYPQIEGQIGVETAVGLLASIGVAAKTTSAVAIITAGIINITIGLAVNTLMSLLVGTPTVRGDIVTTRRRESNLFGDVPLVTSEGVHAPIIFGNPFVGSVNPAGVLISSSLTTDEVA